MAQAFAARFAGRCHNGDDIRPGDEVKYVHVPGHDEASVLVHVGCAEHLDRSTPPDDSAPYCGACFCFHHGDC
ncbi:hypothetical protein H7J86_24410 [Mycobacterium hackensackense]|uniref:hypothetical protein n=1 Tax=Mycobacterium hackensackense TaxID=228909 RepID=UPI002265ACD8|nr:hypothetical protein [Mycobacterium hackensackense]MCV7255311.1 hypothetical protein [Mycobacterium hackensackense]